jgi:YVTN family beta-propeller protein
MPHRAQRLHSLTGPGIENLEINCVRFCRVLIRFIMKINLTPKRLTIAVAALFALAAMLNAAGYQVFVSNEKAGTVTVISGDDFKVTASIPVGKRPRGIHASPDGKIIYVALSGTPIEPPPELDTNGNPILKKNSDDNETKTDKSADGIGLVDVAQKTFLRKIPAGSDPEQFCLSPDGSRIYIANEDVSAATVLNAADGKVLSIIPVTREPEGVGVSPDGKFFYIGCETAGDVFGIDTATFKIIAHLQVHPRPRGVAFSPDGSRAFVTSESSGELNIIDTAQQKIAKVVALPKGSRPQCIRVSADGKKIYASTGRGGTICVVDPATLEVLNTIKVGQRPWGIAISPDGKFLFAANGPSDDVSVVDLAAEKEIARVKSPGGPWGVEVVAEK